jgi:hypothetical protein
MSEPFFDTIPAFAEFKDVVQKDRYRTLPEDWLIGVADVVDSTGALQAGRYKAVNTVGASVISAIMNLDRDASFPFVFGGDGAAFAVPESRHDAAADALAGCQRWAEEEINLQLRAALVPVRDVIAAGKQVRVARFQVSPGVAYAMFSGGGIAWADAAMKSGDYTVALAPPGTRPDLNGLSCRWRPMKAQNGEILSLLVLPRDIGTESEFAELVKEILEILNREAERDGHPVAPDGPTYSWPPQGLGIEVSASRGAKSKFSRAIAIIGEQTIPCILELFGGRLKRFDPAHYKLETMQNTDFRKYDDGLKLTVDCKTGTITEIEKILSTAQEAGTAFFGLYRQDSAVMTCIIPSPFTNDHMHFVDGGSGGYALAAVQLKKAIAAASK